MINPIVYFNGQYLQKSEVHISPDDRGFLFADGIYDVIRFYNGKLFHWPEHQARIKYSIEQLKINFNAFAQLEQIGLELFTRNAFSFEQDVVLYIHITRGEYRRFHGFPPEVIEPTVYVTAYPVSPNYKGMQEGVKVVSTPDIRWGRCDIKSIALIANLMAKQQALEVGGYEALLVKDTIITEGSHSSVFGIKNGALITHPRGTEILPSITRSIITGISEQLAIPLIERHININELTQLDELFLVGTTTQVMPVVQVDHHIIANGSPGPITKSFQGAYTQLVEQFKTT